MELMVSSFTLALAACISIIIAEALHHISVNYISMLIGIVIALVPLLNKQVASFSSEIFMELIVAPLLFLKDKQLDLTM